MKLAKPLTTKEVQRISKEGFTALGGVKGLYLQIRGDSRKFVFRYTSPISNKRNIVSIGDASSLSLAEARAKAAELSEQCASGEDPAEIKKLARHAKKLEKYQEQIKKRQSSLIFSEVAKMWLNNRVKSGYYDQNIRGATVAQSYLDRKINPILGHIPLDEITHKDVFDCLKDLWINTTSAKDKCYRIISQVFRWANAMELTDVVNPCDIKGPLGVLLKNYAPRTKEKHNHPALDPSEMPAFFAQLMHENSVAAKAVAFSILTASRSKPVRNAKWSDINFENKTWTCPEESMKVKGRGAFVVVLSDAAIALLRSLPRLDDTDLVFASPYKHRPLTDAGLGKVITTMHAKRLETEGEGWVDKSQSEAMNEPVKITQHGTARATFTTWARTGENFKRFDKDVIELCLAHKVTDSYDGAYDRATLINERRTLMNAWGDYCTSVLTQC